MNKFPIEHDLLFFASAKWQETNKALRSFLHNYAQEDRVFFLEPPCFATCSELSEYMQLTDIQPSICSVVPVLPRVSQQRERIAMLQRILDRFLREQRVQDYLTWYTHPFGLSFSGHLEPFVTLYDCLNEARLLSALSDEALQLSAELIECADLVLLKRQGNMLYSDIYPFTSFISRKATK